MTFQTKYHFTLKEFSSPAFCFHLKLKKYRKIIKINKLLERPFNYIAPICWLQNEPEWFVKMRMKEIEKLENYFSLEMKIPRNSLVHFFFTDAKEYSISRGISFRFGMKIIFSLSESFLSHLSSRERNFPAGLVLFSGAEHFNLKGRGLEGNFIDRFFWALVLVSIPYVLHFITTKIQKPLKSHPSHQHMKIFLLLCLLFAEKPVRCISPSFAQR